MTAMAMGSVMTVWLSCGSCTMLSHTMCCIACTTLRHSTPQRAYSPPSHHPLANPFQPWNPLSYHWSFSSYPHNTSHSYLRWFISCFSNCFLTKCTCLLRCQIWCQILYSRVCCNWFRFMSFCPLMRCIIRMWCRLVCQYCSFLLSGTTL